MQTQRNQLTGTEIYDSLIHFMTKEFEDFAAIQKQYEHAMEIFQTAVGEQAAAEAANAVRQQTVSNLLFSGFLGLRANLDNFRDPVARNFLDVDSEIYLREEAAHRLPEYACAQSVLDRFYALLSADQKALYEDVISYISYLETTVPKLSHYYGYLLGNELLPRMIPGYHRDMALTARYRMMLRDYFG